MNSTVHGRGGYFRLFTELLALSSQHSARTQELVSTSGKKGKRETEKEHKAFCSFPFHRFAFVPFPPNFYNVCSSDDGAGAAGTRGGAVTPSRGTSFSTGSSP